MVIEQKMNPWRKEVVISLPELTLASARVKLNLKREEVKEYGNISTW